MKRLGKITSLGKKPKGGSSVAFAPPPATAAPAPSGEDAPRRPHPTPVEEEGGALPSYEAVGATGGDTTGGSAAALRQLDELRQENTRLLAENGTLVRQKEGMAAENESLKGQVHLLQFKIELLVDMVTLANLDCDQLQDQVDGKG